MNDVTAPPKTSTVPRPLDGRSEDLRDETGKPRTKRQELQKIEEMWVSRFSMGRCGRSAHKFHLWVFAA